MKPAIDFDSIAVAWQKWEVMLEPCFARLNETLLHRAGIGPNQQVLDLGCGSGNPALLIAQRIQGGRVIGTDISDPMLSVALEKGRALNLSNIVFEHQDMEKLPFEDCSFDAVTSRFALMFTPSPQNATSEALRVLKEGGRISVCVWGDPTKNPLPRDVLRHYCDVPSSDPELPGPYRFAEPGRLMNLFERSGFRGAGEDEIELQEVFESGEQYIQHLIEASALWGSMLRKMAPDQYQVVADHLISEAQQYCRGSQLFIPRFARIVYGQKPL